jgi:hypothetical protein
MDRGGLPGEAPCFVARGAWYPYFLNAIQHLHIIQNMKGCV